MAGHAFNAAERFLLGGWPAASRLERSMESVRKKYQLLCERIVEEFQVSHPEFDMSRVRVTHRSASYGYLWISKRTWPKKRNSAAGIWIENIRLEFLADDEQPGPLASLWLGPMEEHASFDKLKKEIIDRANKVLPHQLLLNSARTLPERAYTFGFEFCDKKGLLSTLTEPDAPRFSSILHEQLDSLSKIVSPIDALLLQ